MMRVPIRSGLLTLGTLLFVCSDRRLILPEYPSMEVLKEKLNIALTHGAVGYDRM